MYGSVFYVFWNWSGSILFVKIVIVWMQQNGRTVKMVPYNWRAVYFYGM